MGVYLNPGNAGFKSARAGRYVDKSGLIAVVNNTIGKKEKLSCISRARRFGKSIAAQMLCAYYDRSCDSSGLFDDLEIAKEPSYREHLNKYNIIYVDITGIIGDSGGLSEVVSEIEKRVGYEIIKEYPNVDKNLSFVGKLAAASESSGVQFIFIIDEWDAMMRDSDSTPKLQKEYLEFLRSLFKSSGTTDKIFAAAYMTGILPIKKDGSQSAISEFREYTMLDPGKYGQFVGFTEDEVRALCDEDDVLTLLIHFGYLSYDAESETVVIPNQEIRDEFSDMIHDVTHEATLKRVQDSICLIEDVVAGNADAVAEQIEKIHRQEYTPLHYNKEQSLRGVIKMAFFAYRDHYLQLDELPGGNGYADIVFFPKKFSDYPALVIELKWNDTPETAINQIKSKHYPDALTGYEGDILLVGISYDKDDEEKLHHCVIEKPDA